jgi:hypothetical protein
MHLQIDEAGERLIRRYVANGSHSWPMRIGLTESRSAGGTEQTAGMLSGHLFGPGGNTTLEYWIDGRPIRAAWKAPQRKRPCRSRALPVDPSFYVSRRLTGMTTSRGDPPPLKWSDLRYVFDTKEDRNGKEAIQA